MTDSKETSDLTDEYEHLLCKVTRMRRKYPSACATYITTYLRGKLDALMNAKVVSSEQVQNIPDNVSFDFVEKINLCEKIQPVTFQFGEVKQQVSDIRDVLSQIRAARHRNLQQ